MQPGEQQLSYGPQVARVVGPEVVGPQPQPGNLVDRKGVKVPQEARDLLRQAGLLLRVEVKQNLRFERDTLDPSIA